MVIDEEYLMEMLQKAYEAGYYGTLDLIKDETEFLMNEIKDKIPKELILNKNYPYVSSYTIYDQNIPVYVPSDF